MNRPTLLVGATVLTVALGGGAWWLGRRDRGMPPQEAALEPFHSEAVGAGELIRLESPATPLRSVRWAPPLPGGAAVAQVLTQTGRQQVVLFSQGVPGPVITLPQPPGIPEGFFQFADLVDAALVPDEALVLLYRSASEPASPALILAWDLRHEQLRWSLRAPGEHLTLSPDRRHLFLSGAETPVAILDMAGRTGHPAPASTAIELPPEVKAVSGLTPLGSRAFLLAHASGLSTWREGVWSHTPAPGPGPSPLAFPAGLGHLAGDGKGGWWQPHPGTLLPWAAGGQIGQPRDLKMLLPESAALDAPLLQLLGEEPDGHLWFGLARPTLASTPPPAPAPAPETTAEAQVPPPAPVAAPVPPAPEPTREAWEAHLAKGLDRLYVWKPGEDRMTLVVPSEVWKRLMPPPGIQAPAGNGLLRPEAGALISGSPDRSWWLPLKALRRP